MLQELGKRGENIAASFLKKHGYTIITTRFLKRVGEIDVIAHDPQTNEVVFVEVKTRRTTTFGWPEESITQQKLNKIVKTALWFLLEHQYNHQQTWRIDAIGILINTQTNQAHIKHFKRVET